MLQLLFVRGVSSMLALFMVYLISTLFSSFDSGIFFYNQGLVVFLSVVIGLGANGYIMQACIKSDVGSNVRTLKVLTLQCVYFGIFLSTVIFFVGPYILDVELYFATLLGLILYGLSSIFYSFCLGSLYQLQGVILHLLFPNLTLVVLAGVVNSIQDLYCFWVFSYAVSCFAFIVFIGKQQKGVEGYGEKPSLQKRGHFFQQEILGQIFNSLVIVVASYVLVVEKLMELTVYQKYLSVCLLLVGTVNISMTPSLSTLYIQGRWLHARSKILRCSMILCVIVIIYLASLLIFHFQLFELLPNLSVNWIGFFALSLSFIIVSLMGPAHYLLNMLDRQREALYIVYFFSALGVSLILLLGLSFGVSGILFALAASIGGQAIVMRLYLERLNGK